MRECGGCTLCCIVMGVEPLSKQPGEVCPHLDRRRRCTIYGSRPHDCQVFTCSWLAEDIPKRHLRPDQCGVVFETIAIGQIGTGAVLQVLFGGVHNPRLAARAKQLFKALSRPGRIVTVEGKGLNLRYGEPGELAYYDAWVNKTQQDGRVVHQSKGTAAKTMLHV